MQNVFIEMPDRASKIAKEFAAILRNNAAKFEDSAFSLIRCFMMHMMGLLEYRIAKDGLCEFIQTDRRVIVVDADGVSHDFVDKYV